MIRILYVDDEPALLSLGKSHIELRSRFIVDTAISGSEAISLLKKQSYDAIISDYYMPDIDGLTFLKGIRTFNPHIPFIIFTGHGEEAVVIEALNNGADFYLTKGYDLAIQLNEIIQIIQILVSRSRSGEELRKSEEKFRIITEYSHEWLYWINSDTGLEYISPSCYQITGYTRKEFYKNLDLIDQIIYPPDKVSWFTHLNECGKNNDNDSKSWDFRINHKNGEVRWIRHACQPIFYSDGRFAGLRVCNQDITSQKSAEEKLHRERDNFLKIFRAAPVGLLLLDSNTEIKQANAAISAVVLRDPAEIIRNRVGSGIRCIHSLDGSNQCGYSNSCPSCPLRKGIEAVITSHESIHNEVISLTLQIDGKPQVRRLKVNVEPVEIDGSDHVIVAIDDITENREMEI